jgi:hypothetical protein
MGGERPAGAQMIKTAHSKPFWSDHFTSVRRTGYISPRIEIHSFGVLFDRQREARLWFG